MDSGVQKVASAVNYESCREQGEQRDRGGGVFWESEEVADCNVCHGKMRLRLGEYCAVHSFIPLKAKI